MNTKRQYKTYPKEFKEETVARITEQNYSVSEAVKAVGIRENMLYKWKQKIDAEKSGQTLNSDDKSELLGLRKEVKQLRMEKEILKKASTFFAKEMK
jgi:transposase